MYEQLIQAAGPFGLFAVLFVALLWYVLQDSRNREKRYCETIAENQKIIINLTEKFCVVDDINKDVQDIKAELKRR
jgi:hypothetical protein